MKSEIAWQPRGPGVYVHMYNSQGTSSTGSISVCCFVVLRSRGTKCWEPLADVLYRVEGRPRHDVVSVCVVFRGSPKACSVIRRAVQLNSREPAVFCQIELLPCFRLFPTEKSRQAGLHSSMHNACLARHAEETRHTP